MEHSSEENAGTERLQKLHEMVTAVKRDGKVGLTYMKSFEIEQRIRREGIEQGKAEGRFEGRAEGKAEGRIEGRAEGKAEGRSEGKAEDIMELLCELGEVPLSVQSQITSQKDDGILRSWLKLAAKAESVQDFARKAFTT